MHFVHIIIVWSCMTFQYLTVSCIPAIGHLYDISIPDKVSESNLPMFQLNAPVVIRATTGAFSQNVIL